MGPETQPPTHATTDAATDPAVGRATGVLVLALRRPAHEAERRLHDAALRHRVAIAELAHAVTTAAGGGEVLDPRLGAVLRAEWGDLLA